MKGRIIIAAFAAVLLASFSIAAAGGRSGGSAGSGSGTTGGNKTRAEQGDLDRDRIQDQTRTHDQDQGQLGDRDKTQVQDRLRTRTKDGEGEPVYTTEDGQVYRWQNRYNHRLQKLEGQGDDEGLNALLNRIAERHHFNKAGEAEGFVQWALRSRPWEEEQ